MRRCMEIQGTTGSSLRGAIIATCINTITELVFSGRASWRR